MAQNSILVLDCGGADAMQIARSVRSIGVYCEIVDAKRGFESFAGRNPAGMIALGGVGFACEMPPVLLASGVPILAIGEAARTLLTAAGGQVEGVAGERKVLEIQQTGQSALLEGVEGGMRFVERAYRVALPKGFRCFAGEGDAALVFGDDERKLYGMQFQLERNDVDGYRALSNFLYHICQCDGGWTIQTYLESAINGMRNRVGKATAICPMTGGVDTAVCAALAHSALGEGARCLLIDTGLMTLGEADGIVRAFRDELGISIERIDASDRFLRRLAGVTDPILKRQVVAAEFARVLREQDAGEGAGEQFLIRGAIYDDVLAGVTNLSTAGAPEHWTALEPLRGLFKREVRELGKMLKLPDAIVRRQPFPSAGLAVRCLGEVTPGRIALLRGADAVFKRVLEEAGADKGLQMYFTVLTGLLTLNSDGEREGETVVLRAVQQRDTGRMHAVRMPFDLLEGATEAILREVPGIKRVLYDLTPRPPAAVEME